MTMPKRSRFRRILKWVGLTVSSVVLLVWLTSIWFGFGYRADSWCIRLGDAIVRHDKYPELLSMHLTPDSYRSRNRPTGWYRLAERSLSWSAFKDEIGRLVLNRLPADHLTTHPEIVRQRAWKQLARRIGFIEPSFVFHDYGRTRSSTIPMWMVFLLMVVPTALFWWRDRRYPPGHCQTCGYNLTGNTSGIGPECGKPCELDTAIPKPPP